jgi:hypothetical protein
VELLYLSDYTLFANPAVGGDAGGGY